jgi:hypothetical protein
MTGKKWKNRISTAMTESAVSSIDRASVVKIVRATAISRKRTPIWKGATRSGAIIGRG